jgi:hypothetical protein
VTFFFAAGQVAGELQAKESEKHIPRWVELDKLSDQTIHSCHFVQAASSQRPFGMEQARLRLEIQMVDS